MARSKPTAEDVEIHRITERNRTFRWLFVCILIGSGIWKIADEVGDYFDKPAWEVVLNMLVALVIALLAPGAIYLVIVHKIRRFTERIAPAMPA